MGLSGYDDDPIFRVIVGETDERKRKKTGIYTTASTGILSDISHEHWLKTQKLIKLSSVRNFDQIKLGVGSRKANKTTKILSTTKNLNHWHDAQNSIE